jgi:RNA polymerase sigma-70 factor, ECF subfamily
MQQALEPGRVALDLSRESTRHSACVDGSAPVKDRSQTVNPGDEELVASARRGDRRAFEELVERHKRKAYHIAFDFTRDGEDAKDLSQDAFLKAFTNLKNFDGRSSFYTWFYRILVNLCLDYKRRNKRGPATEFDETTIGQMEPSHEPTRPRSPDQQVLARQISLKVGEALEALPARQRAAFVLKNHQGLSIKEIAELLDTAEGTVKVHLHRAVTALRERLAEFV